MSKTLVDTLSHHAPRALAVLRIMTALLFIEHGTQKLFGFPAPQAEVPLSPLTLVAGILETFGGFLVLIGFLTRPTAFLLSGMMAVGYWMFHAPRGFFPIHNMGDAAILFCFVFLYFVFSGPGAWSVDKLRGGQA